MSLIQRLSNLKRNKPKIIKLVLVLIFIISSSIAYESGIQTSSGVQAGGAIGFGFIAAAALLGFVYYESNKQTIDSDKKSS